jgi:FAD/FMN-containing dehydrogenases
MRTYNETNVNIIPSDKHTKLANDTITTNDEIVISLSRMNQLNPIDELDHTIRVGTNTITQTIHEHYTKINLN